MKKLLVLLLASLCIVGAAQATIVDNGDYLTDTASGLDWLDATKTVNMSYDYVNAQLGNGGQFAGWRYATGLEFNTLVSHFTNEIVTGFDPVDQEFNKIDGLIGLFGSTLDSAMMGLYGKTYDAYFGYAPGDGIAFTYGFIADTTIENGLMMQWTAMLWDYDQSTDISDYSNAHSVWGSGSFAQDTLGSFLVRQHRVPEPSSILLMLIACIGMVGAMHSRKSIK